MLICCLFLYLFNYLSLICCCFLCFCFILLSHFLIFSHFLKTFILICSLMIHFENNLTPLYEKTLYFALFEVNFQILHAIAIGSNAVTTAFCPLQYGGQVASLCERRLLSMCRGQWSLQC